MKPPSVLDLMTPSPCMCHPCDSLELAARLMAECDCGAIPVVDDSFCQRPVGILTDRDIVIRVIAAGKSIPDHAVREVMSSDPIIVHVDASFQDCARAMMTYRIRRVLVVDDRGKIIGIVTDGDLARACRQNPQLEHDLATMVEQVSAPPHFVPPHHVYSAIGVPAVRINRPIGD